MKKREDGRQLAAFNLALAEVQRRRRTFNQSHVSLCLSSGALCCVFLSDGGHMMCGILGFVHFCKSFLRSEPPAAAERSCDFSSTEDL